MITVGKPRPHLSNIGNQVIPLKSLNPNYSKPGGHTQINYVIVNTKLNPNSIPKKTGRKKGYKMINTSEGYK